MAVCDSQLTVTSRKTVSQSIFDMQKSVELKWEIKSVRYPKLWVSRVTLGHLTFIKVIYPSVNGEWVLRNALLDFMRFPTSHNVETILTMLFELLSNSNTLGNIRAITKDNANVICSAMGKWWTMLNIWNSTLKVLTDLHLRCIAHVINLATCDCLKKVHGQIDQIRSLLSALGSSIKRHGIFESTRRQLRLTVTLPGLDVVTRWSSSFEMVQKACKSSTV